MGQVARRDAAAIVVRFAAGRDIRMPWRGWVVLRQHSDVFKLWSGQAISSFGSASLPVPGLLREFLDHAAQLTACVVPHDPTVIAHDRLHLEGRQLLH